MSKYGAKKQKRLDVIHQKARKQSGGYWIVYRITHKFLGMILNMVFPIIITGEENIPSKGAAIIAPNHKSFADSFFIALATKRPIRSMSMEKPFLIPGVAWLMIKWGAFPVVRGAGDKQAMLTANVLLAQGELYSMFPEGRKIRGADELGDPRSGVGRLALETGSMVIPCAISGTARERWFGIIPKPRRIHIKFMEPVIISNSSANNKNEIKNFTKDKIWSGVQRGFNEVRKEAKENPEVSAVVITSIIATGGLIIKKFMKK